MPEEATKSEQDRLQREQDKQGRDQDKLDARLLILDTKLGSIDGRLIRVEEHLVSIDGRLDRHSSALEKIDGKLDNFAAMQMTISAHTEEIGTLKKWASTVYAKMLAAAVGIMTIIMTIFNIIWKVFAGK